MRHPSIQVVYGGIVDMHEHGHDNMDETLCVWTEKHMGGFEGALHLTYSSYVWDIYMDEK